MTKDVIRQYMNEKCKRGPILRSLFLGLVVTISLALVYAERIPREKSVAGPLLHPIAPVAHEAANQAILRWMKENSDMPEHVLMTIYRVAMKSVNADLILAVCLVESNFNPHVESEKGAIGLMGIMPGVWLEELEARGIVREREDLFSISNNIASGAYVLERYLEKTDNLSDALSRYAGGDPLYAAKVMQMMRKISVTRRAGESADPSGVQS
jgi:hypothetical protein